MGDYLFNTDKLRYIKGDKPDVECILCAVRDAHPGVKVLEVHRTDRFIVSLNLYPFNPGHLLVFPSRHVVDIRELDEAEAIELHCLTALVLSALEQEFQPAGFNVGYNLGRGGGASIAHLHQHIVPRYGNELGFLDVLAGTRVMVVDPLEVMDRLKKRIRP